MQLEEGGIKTIEVKEGIQAGLNIAIGYIPIAITFGFLSKGVSLTFIESVCMSAFVFAGASQFMAINLLAISSHFEIVLATFILNIRHLLMSTALKKRVEPAAWWKKSLYAFMITDESFSVAATRKTLLTTHYLISLNFTAYTSWVVFTAVGYQFGNSLPTSLQESMAISLYAMFIALLIPSVKRSRKVLILAISSAVINSLLTEFSILASGWSIVVATLISAVLVEWIWSKSVVQPI